MKLILDAVEGWCVSSKSGEVPIANFCKAERERQGLSRGALNSEMGVAHQNYTNFENGKTHSITIGLQALQALGYDIFVMGSRQ